MRKVFLSVLVGFIFLGSIVLSSRGIPDFVTRLHIAQCSALLDRGLNNEAIELLSEIITNNPNMYRAYYLRAWAYYDMGNYDIAMSDINKALELTWSYYDLHFLKAQIYIKIGQPEEAMYEFSWCIAVYPTLPRSYVLRAMINYDRHQYYKVLKDCQKAILLDPNQAGAYVTRGLVYAKAGEVDRNELDKAIADFSKSIELVPNAPSAYYYRGLAYKKQGNTAKAIGDFNKVVILGNDPETIQMAKQQIEELSN